MSTNGGGRSEEKSKDKQGDFHHHFSRKKMKSVNKEKKTVFFNLFLKVYSILLKMAS
jgi:hypothetical protein